MIPRLFGLHSCFIFQDGQRYVCYKNLVERSELSDQKIVLSDMCTKVKCTETVLQFQMPLSTIIDGNQEHTVTVTQNDTVLHLRGNAFCIGYGFPINQRCIDGIVHLIAMVRLCNGVETSGNDNVVFIRQQVSSLQDKQLKSKIKSKSCKIILDCNSKCDCCYTCTNCVKQNRQRAKMEDDINIKKTKHSNEEVVDKENKKPSDDMDSSSETITKDTEGSTFPSTINLCEEDHNDMKDILNRIISNGAPENFKLLLESQLENCKKALDKHQRRWDPNVISICLGIYLRSPKAYRDLPEAGILVLPSERLLRYYKNSVKQTPSFNEDNIKWMSKEPTSQKISDFGKHGGIVIDEMSIQDDLVLTKSGDSWKLVGFVDMDSTNNNINIICNGRKKLELSTHALQFVFHGFTGFRWPVVYFGSCPATAHQVYNTFWKCVDILDENGFTVDYVMTDGASPNRTFGNMLFVNSPRDDNFIYPDVFYKEHKMCLSQDIMHVLKRIRNNIESSWMSHKTTAGRYLLLNNHPIVWGHWTECFHFNFQNGFHIHRKLTEEHINITLASKMRNKLATDVLDKNMLYLMKIYQATLHCQKKHLITRETRDDINCSVVGFISLCKLHLGRGNSLNPGFLNSDIVENLFGQHRGIRNGLNDNPTLAQYGPANTAIILGQCTVSKKANSGKTASFFKATTPCALNHGQNKSNKKLGRPMRL